MSYRCNNIDRNRPRVVHGPRYRHKIAAYRANGFCWVGFRPKLAKKILRQSPRDHDDGSVIKSVRPHSTVNVMMTVVTQVHNLCESLSESWPPENSVRILRICGANSWPAAHIYCRYVAPNYVYCYYVLWRCIVFDGFWVTNGHRRRLRRGYYYYTSYIEYGLLWPI